MRRIKAGELVLMTNGEYSDFRIAAAFRATTKFEPDLIQDEWLSIHPEQQEKYRFDAYAFLKWVCIDKGLLEETDYVEWWFGQGWNADSGNLTTVESFERNVTVEDAR